MTLPLLATGTGGTQRPESDIFVHQRPKECYSTFINSEKSIYDGRLFAAECCLSVFQCIHWGQLALTCIWNTRRERSGRFAVDNIPEQNNLMVYSQADAWPCLLCSQNVQIQLESPLKAKGIAFSLKAEWHWFYSFLSPLLQPLQGHSVFLELFMNVTSGFKKSFCEHFPHICMNHCSSPLELVYDFNPATWVKFWFMDSFLKPRWLLFWFVKYICLFCDPAVFHISQ